MEKQLIHILIHLAVVIICIYGKTDFSEISKLNEIQYDYRKTTINYQQCQQCDCTMLTADCSGRKIKTLPLDLPSNITTLNLSNNLISNLPDYLMGQYYKNLQTFDILGNKLLANLSEYTFQGLDALDTIRLIGSTYVHPYIFKPLKKIRIITVKNSIYGSRPYPSSRIAWLQAFEGLQNSTIQELTYKHITTIPFILKKTSFKSLKKCQLKELHLPNNFISGIETGFLKYLPELEILDLSQNMIATFIPRNNLNWAFQFYKMVHLRKIRVSDSRLREVQRLDFARNITCLDTEWPLPLALEVIDISGTVYDSRPGSISCEWKFQRKNRIKVFNATNTNAFTYIGGPIKGLVNLQHLIYSKNHCKIVPEFFTCVSGYFENLQVLDLSYNIIQLSRPSSDIALFENCSELAYLDISFNELRGIPKGIFKDAFSLETINLGGNKLRRFHVDLSNQISLKNLNLSQNILQDLDETARNNINIANERSNGQLIIDLCGNPLMCSCDHFEFINWIKDNMGMIHQGTELTCLYLNGSEVKFTELNVSYMKFECWRSIIMASGISVLFVLIIVGFVIYGYKRRYKIIYVVLHIKALLRRKQLPNIDYDFDGFISYSSLDKTWALKNIYAQLVAKYGYNICVDDRNFVPGAYISDIIVESISKSNKIILIISQNFLRSGWCKFEMNLARGELATRGRDCLILILKEPIELLPPELITPTLRSLLETRVYLQWSEEEDRKLLLWRKLCDALGNPRFRGEEDSPYLYQNNDGDEEIIQALTEPDI